MKTIAENSAINFKIALESYKCIKGYSDEQLAEDLGCSTKTVSNLRKDPLSGSGRYILPLLEKLKIAERNRYA